MCYLPSVHSNRWLAVRLEFVGSVIILSAGLLAVTAVVNSNVDAGLVGLVLSYALNTTGSLVSRCRNWLSSLLSRLGTLELACSLGE